MAMVRQMGEVTVKVMPCRMYPSSQDYGFDIALINVPNRGICIKGHTTCEIVGKDEHGYAIYDHMPMLFDTWYNQWAYYNTDNERGLYAHYYINA